MPRRRRKRTATQKPPLNFVESPLNAHRNFPTPVQCSIYPVTANTVSVQLATGWVSPQFKGKLLQGERLRHTSHRLGRHRTSSFDSTLRNISNAEHVGRTKHKRKPMLRPLKFVLESRSEETSPISNDEGDSDQSTKNKTNEKETQRMAESSEKENSFLAIRLLHVTTPEEDEGPVGNDNLSFVLCKETQSSEKKKKISNLSRCLFQNAEHNNVCSNTVRDTQFQLTPKSCDLKHMSFESKDSTFVGCMPRANLLNGSILPQDASFSFESTECSFMDNTVLTKSSQQTVKSRTVTNIDCGQSCRLQRRLQGKILSSVSMETPPNEVKQARILVFDTPVSDYGLSYRQKQLKGFL